MSKQFNDNLRRSVDMLGDTAVRRSVLFIGAGACEHASLRHIFRDSPWAFHGAFTGRDGLSLLRQTHQQIGLVICDHCLPDGDWKSVLAALDSMEDRPVLIVSSRLADERLWAEVLNLGAFDLLLGSPFVPEEVLRVTQSATLVGSQVGDAQYGTRSNPDVCRGLKDSLTIAGTAGGGA